MKKLLKKAGILLLLCLVLLVYFMGKEIIGILAIGGEWFLVKLNNQNPYVNNHYEGWQVVAVEDTYHFYLPPNWSLEQGDDVYTIRNEDGEVWAYGAVVDRETGQFATFRDFCTAALDEEILEISMGEFPEAIMMNGSYINQMVVSTSDSSETVFFIEMLIDTKTSLYWLLTVDLSADDSQFDIAEAIMYSYAFQK